MSTTQDKYKSAVIKMLHESEFLTFEAAVEKTTSAGHFSSCSGAQKKNLTLTILWRQALSADEDQRIRSDALEQLINKAFGEIFSQKKNITVHWWRWDEVERLEKASKRTLKYCSCASYNCPSVFLTCFLFIPKTLSAVCSYLLVWDKHKTH